MCPRTPIASQGAHECSFGVTNTVGNPVRSRNFFPFLQKSNNLRLLGRRFGDQLGNSSPGAWNGDARSAAGTQMRLGQ